MVLFIGRWLSLLRGGCVAHLWCAGETGNVVPGVGVSTSVLANVETLAAAAEAHSFATSQAAHSAADNLVRENEGADDLVLPVQVTDEAVREHKRKLREMMFLQVLFMLIGYPGVHHRAHGVSLTRRPIRVLLCAPLVV